MDHQNHISSLRNKFIQCILHPSSKLFIESIRQKFKIF